MYAWNDDDIQCCFRPEVILGLYLHLKLKKQWESLMNFAAIGFKHYYTSISCELYKTKQFGIRSV
jgi:hypothetical protein